MAATILTFPQRLTPATSTPAEARHTFAPLSGSRHGLFIATANMVANTTRSRDTLAQAIRIVAQVEQEIARQAERQRTAHLVSTPTHVIEAEPATSIARRIISTLFSFARPA
jgi:hypothetical protein